MALISQAFSIKPNPDISAKVVMVTLILRKADILIRKSIFHHSIQEKSGRRDVLFYGS